MADDSLAGDLRQHIYQAYYDGDGPRGGKHWVMSTEWLNEVRKLDDSAGHVLFAPSLTASAPLVLIGIPVEVREDGGPPHLDPDG